MHQDDLIRSLRELAKEPPREAPPAVKTRTLAAYRAHFRRRRYLRMSWTAAAAALLTVALLIPQARVRTPPVASVLPPDLTRFVMLDDEPIGNGLVVRVKLPISAFGESHSGELDTREVEADVLLGEDGLAHGIRLVI
jgi:hypothetical protein